MAASIIQRNYHAESLPGNKYLSKTFQSSVLHTPADTTRRTISTENYLRLIAKDFHQPPTPWGRKDSYGGRGVIHLKGTPTGHDMVIVAKGSQHYGSGISATPRGVTVQQTYSITPLMKSNLRSNDELTPSPTKVNMQEHQVDKPFPSGHPFQSHTSVAEMFPDTSKPANDEDDRENTTYQEYIHPADSPASAPEQTVFSKTHGSPYRHEEISIPLDSGRKPMTWPQGPTFYQVPRSFHGDQNKYYPTPRTQLHSSSLQSCYPVSKSTLDALNDANKSLWKSTYQNDFTKSVQQSRLSKGVQQKQECSKESEIIARLINENSKAKPHNKEEHLENNNRKVHFDDNKANKENQSEQLKYKFSRPKYSGARTFSSILPKEPIKPIFSQRSQTSIPKSNTTNEHFTRYSPIELEKTGLLRQFATNHPSSITVPDLRDLRNNTKLMMEKRHFIPEANGANSYTFH